MSRPPAKRVLISFVGTNDAGRLDGPHDGAVLTALSARSFDDVHLLWNTSTSKRRSFEAIAKYVKAELLARRLASRVTLHRFPLADVTDHNEIYPNLLAVCRRLRLPQGVRVTAAIASGTPAMQACWILMAESGDYPLELIRSNEPGLHRPPVTPVKLSTALPRILRLEREMEVLKEENLTLIPTLELQISRGHAAVGKVLLPLSPIGFAYYRYFADRAKAGLPPERMGGVFAPRGFLEAIERAHRESFPDAEPFRADLRRMMKQGLELDMRTFRANVSKTNARIRSTLGNPSLSRLFEITADGRRHAKAFGLKVPKEKILIRS